MRLQNTFLEQSLDSRIALVRSIRAKREQVRVQKRTAKPALSFDKSLTSGEKKKRAPKETKQQILTRLLNIEDL